MVTYTSAIRKVFGIHLVIHYNKSVAPPSKLFRYRPINNYTLDELNKKYLWFSNPNDFNDPFDGVTFFDGKFSDSFVKNIFKAAVKGDSKALACIDENFYNYTMEPELRNVLNSRVQATVSHEFSKFMKLCCFSKVKNEILMWSHYADNHRGICLEYDSKLIRLDRETKLFIYPIKYSSDVAIGNFENDVVSAAILAYTQKYKKWEYEEEFRAIITSDENKININPAALKSITFGCCTPLSQKKEIRDILGDSVLYYRYRMGSSKYELVQENEDFEDHGWDFHNKYRREL